LSLRINAIVDDHIAVAVALVFAKLSIIGIAAGYNAWSCQLRQSPAAAKAYFPLWAMPMEFPQIFMNFLTHPMEIP
jgi:cytochrome b subunit of formate dehydrogenase